MQQNNIKPKISVVMPAYNCARTLFQAINSVLRQAYRDYELIICNDASTDKTRNILDDIKDDRILIIHNTVNLGEGPSRDRAIELARGVWIAFIDADDAWAPERLEVVLREAHSSLDNIVFDDIWECHDTASGMVPWHVLRGKYAFGGDGIHSIEVPIENYILQKRLLKSALFPLKYIKKYNIRHDCLPFYADINFFLKLLAHDVKLYYIPKPMYYYRITPMSMSAEAKRHALMREVLENSINLFNHAPVVQAALRKRISMVRRNEKYFPFVLSLKKYNFINALRIVCRSPWIILEFFRRLGPSLFYHIHRIWHGGKSRGFR